MIQSGEEKRRAARCLIACASTECQRQWATEQLEARGHDWVIANLTVSPVERLAADLALMSAHVQSLPTAERRLWEPSVEQLRREIAARRRREAAPRNLRATVSQKTCASAWRRQQRTRRRRRSAVRRGTSRRGSVSDPPPEPDPSRAGCAPVPASRLNPSSVGQGVRRVR